MKSFSQVFPYFGGKRRVAEAVWERFGAVDGYIEPFAGSLAVALNNPNPGALKSENLNDLNGFICNFWRAIASCPDAVSRFADWPVNHIDLKARHAWLMEQAADLDVRLALDINYCDPRIAGVWLWGISQWIGSGWCSVQTNQRPHLGNHGMGVHSLGKRPHLSNTGMGVHSLGQRSSFYEFHADLAVRLRFSRVTCCSWESLKSGLHSGCSDWGVFLDPPYTAESGRDPTIYSTDSLTLGHEVAAWARELGRDGYKVALCGLLQEYDMPEDWEVYDWSTSGFTMGGRDAGEVIWFSPACKRKAKQGGLF